MLVPTRRTEDLFAGWWRLIARLGAVPRTLVWDGEGAIGRWRGRRSELTGDCQAFRGTLATKVIICKPADPEAKGLVERFHDYLERSFLPGRSFDSPADFNTQLDGFVAKANVRQHRALGCRPADRVDGDRQEMLTLPPVPPVVGWALTRLARDHYVRLDGNDYSVHPAVSADTSAPLASRWALSSAGSAYVETTQVRGLLVDPRSGGTGSCHARGTGLVGATDPLGARRCAAIAG